MERQKDSTGWRSIVFVLGVSIALPFLLSSLTTQDYDTGSRKMMNVTQHKKAKITYPTGNPKFSVYQAFPAGIREEDADPFLMCDHFGPVMETKGPATDPDEFPIDWHPHRGFSIATYLISGVGRHADSLGNRGTFESPGLQWMNVGSGVMHAEGGGTPKGVWTEGFQIWVNLPSALKMDPPTYGTVVPSLLPTLYLTQKQEDRQVVLGSAQKDESLVGVVATVRFVAGSFSSKTTYFGQKGGSKYSSSDFSGKGPFETVQPVQIVDADLGTKTPFSDSNSTAVSQADNAYFHQVPSDLDSCTVYVYRGGGTINSKDVKQYDVISFDAKGSARDLKVEPGSDGIAVMIFAGKRLNQPIAWRGPMVMTTPEEIQTAYLEFQRGTFLKKRAAWDYMKASEAPPSGSAH